MLGIRDGREQETSRQPSVMSDSIQLLIACGVQLNHTLLAKQGVDEDIGKVADNGIDECIDEDMEEIINVRHGVKTYNHSL